MLTKLSNKNDELISRLTVRFTNVKDGSTIGTGFICYQRNLNDTVYILTASHCLFQDEEFKNILSDVIIDVYDLATNSYKPISIKPDENLLYKDPNKDVAILCFNKSEIEKIIGEIPIIKVINEHHSFNEFVIKGFPNATQGKELDVIYPTWKQNMTEVPKFQLQLNEDYNNWATKGFSGSGAFLQANNEVYLLGIFTRFRPEDRGRVIYCQFIKTVNELLENNYLPTISYSYLGELGLTPDFFETYVKKAIKNLGQRFSESLNFRLPIARKFNDISKDKLFYVRLHKIFDNWLTEKNYKQLTSNPQIGKIETDLKNLKNSVEEWFLRKKFNPETLIELEWIYNGIESLNDSIYDKIDALNKLGDEEEKKNPPNPKNYSYRRPYHSETERLREILSANNDFTNSLVEDINFQLANVPFLFIKGEAGCGKSHLLGDIANERIKNQLPTILLLGQHFHNSQTVENNILSQLDKHCSFTELLTGLNNIGKQIDSRVLIMIDAINESTGNMMWKEYLAGLIEQISKYPFIGVVITIRNSYFESIVPQPLRDNKTITFINHEGFNGNEYAALKLFCEYYGLEQPKFPILSPEFTTPLFLKLICDGISNSKDKIFPNGFQGINKIFGFYLDSLNEKFLLKPEYLLKNYLVREAIYKVAFLCFQQERRALILNDAIELFEKSFSNYPMLLVDLIQEGVLIKNLTKRYDSDEEIELVYFAYERLGDFYIAHDLLSQFDVEELKIAFQKGNQLGKLLDDFTHEGVLEALAVLLPENNGLEIFEVFDWVFTKHELENQIQKFWFENAIERINYFFLRSLKWRLTGSVDNEKITRWFNTGNFNVRDVDFFSTLIELTTIEKHPMNSDRLFKKLSCFTMAERDSFWQIDMVELCGHTDDNVAFPLRRLIDWAWTPNISSNINAETARLTGQTLVWVLSTTNKKLRDETTKALVNLLEQQPEALIALLDSFKNVNDFYISERLYAVAYGCILRTEKPESIKKISQFIYDIIFKKENSPKHILLRDYARNTIEYALYKKVEINVNVDLVRPPYKSELPKFPSDEDIKQYSLDHDSSEYKNNQYGNLFNKVHFSVMAWDFGRKIVEPTIDDFSAISFTQEPIYKAFLAKLNKKQKQIIGILKSNTESKQRIENKRYNIGQDRQEEYKKYSQLIEKSRLDIIELIEQHFSEAQTRYIIDEISPYFINKLNIKIGNFFKGGLPAKPIKRWIVKRVFELGYDVKLHGHYDNNYSNHSGYKWKAHVERISKKYQWIAYHEILAILTDNYKLDDGWSSKKKYDYYKGSWQMFLRNIDPAFVKRNTKNHDDDLNNDLILIQERYWWSEPEYKYWNIPTQEWRLKLEDLPNPKDVIIKQDESNVEWVYLKNSANWDEPKRLGKDKYSTDRKNIWYLLEAYLINKSDKRKILAHLSNKSFHGRWMPENRDNFSRLINREKFWSPAYFHEGKEKKWEYIPNTKYKVIVATTDAKGSLEGDQSGANTTYDIPCKTLFEGMNLQYARIDGDFLDENGDLVATNINPKGVLIKKDALFKYLVENDLEIFWTILGEKVASESEEGRPMGRFSIGMPSGVFYFEDGLFKGSLNMYNN